MLQSKHKPRFSLSFVKIISLSYLLAIIVITSCSSPKTRAEQKPVKKPGNQQGYAGGASAIWDNECSGCHSQDQLHGKSESDIHAALERVPIMAGYKQMLSDKNIQDLAEMLSGRQSNEKYTFITPKACNTCHKSHVEQWQFSMHALAHTESVYDRYFIKASLDSDGKLQPFCAGCHTPLAVFNGNIPFKNPVLKPGDTRVDKVESDGVQCDFCHIVNGRRGDPPGNGNYTLNPSRTKYGPFTDSKSPFHLTAYSELHTISDFCGACHDVTHPGNGIVLESTFTEWKQGPYAREGVQCQDCHMTRGLTKRVEQPGIAATKGPERPHVSEHFFVGPNMLFNGGPEAAKNRELSEKLLKNSAVVEIKNAVPANDAVSLTIDVTNTGAGHYMPTGVSEIRELWLEIVVTDDSGKTLYHAGKLDNNGSLSMKPEPVLYYTYVKDKTGKITTQFWNTVEKVKDHRLPPRETVTETVRLPATLAGEKVKVSVKLQYRSISPDGLEEVGAPRDLVKIPVFTISEHSREFSL